MSGSRLLLRKLTPEAHFARRSRNEHRCRCPWCFLRTTPSVRLQQGFTVFAQGWESRVWDHPLRRRISLRIRIGSVYLTAMSEEDDPLARDGNWRRLSISFDDPRAMEQMGPNLEVSIAAVTEQGTTSATIADFLKEGLDSGQAVVGIRRATHRPLWPTLQRWWKRCTPGSNRRSFIVGANRIWCR
jgi:hypothetical protein